MTRLISAIAIALAVLAAPAAARPPHPSSAPWRDCRRCPQLVRIPGGTFRMGAPAGEAGSSDLERPVHNVTIKPFALGRFDVTRGEWATFVRATRRPTVNGCAFTGRPGPFLDPRGSWRDTGFAQDDRHPVVCINFRDATDYAAWLSRRTGRHYRMPSEAEWEYAARAGSTTLFYWGRVADHDHANYGHDESAGKGRAFGHDRWLGTSPVGAFPPNPFGLYDVSGNVLQYVADCLGSYADAPTDGSPQRRGAPLRLGGDFKELNGMNACDFRMARGGDWGDPPEMLRSAFRNFAPSPPDTLTTYRSTGVGFRVARDL